jgi:hypothetical protein
MMETLHPFPPDVARGRTISIAFNLLEHECFVIAPTFPWAGANPID